MNKNIKKLIYLLCSFFIFFVFIFVTPFGLGLSPDSISYLKGAQGLLNGKGITYFSNQWPPIYPLLLAIFGFPFSDAILGARILNALLYALNFVIIAELIERITKQGVWLSTVLAGLLCIQIPMTYVYFYAWSEPTLLLFVSLNFLLISSLNSYNQSIIRVALIALASLALLTRFAGIVVAVTNCIVIFFLFTDKSILSRIKLSLFQLVIPALIFLPWTSHRGISDGNATARVIEFHPISLQTIGKGLMTIGGWLNPFSIQSYGQPFNLTQFILGVSLIGITCTFLIVTVFNLLKVRNSGLDNFTSQTAVLMFAAAQLIVTYGCFLIAALSFVDNKVELDNRILVLMYPPMMLLLIGYIFRFKSVTLRLLLLILLMLIMVTALPKLRGWMQLSRYSGIEMNTRGAINSSIQLFIRGCAKDLQAYADNPWNFDLHFNKKVFWIPGRVLYNSGRINDAYEKQLAEMLSNAQLIVLENKNDELDAIIATSNKFVKIRSSGDGVVWKKNLPDATCLE